MSWRNVRLIFLREVRDQLRDRRTLFMIVVLPLLLYPALGIGMFGMTLSFTQQTRTVAVLGTEGLPEPTLIDGDRFSDRWFDSQAQSSLLRVISDAPVGRESVSDGVESEGVAEDERRGILQTARRVRDAFEEYRRLEEAKSGSVDVAPANGDAGIDSRLAAAQRRLAGVFDTSGLEALILVPPDMNSRLSEANEQLRERDGSASRVDVPQIAVLYNGADEKSAVAYRGVRDVLDRWEDELLKNRLRIAEVPVDLPDEIAPNVVDLASEKERSQALWSKLFPALLVIMTVTGAFYPAVDLAAGEKERGTMETLLICPASRTEIVVGKFLTVLLFSSFTALLNLLTMGLTGRFMASLALGNAMSNSDIFAPPVAAVFWVVVLLLPLAALFSALCLSLATFARSSKEGQYHLTPLLLVTIGLTVFCLSPAVEITPLYSVLPVIGISLLLKELLAGGGGYVYLAPVLATSFGYAVLALWWAVEQFNREDVLFREAEQFDLKLWLTRLLKEKGETPSFAESVCCFVLIMLLQFGAMKLFSGAFAGTSADDYDDRVLQVLLVQQFAIVAGPALLMGLLLTRSLWKTLRLRLPGVKYFLVGFVLPLALVPLATTLLSKLSWFFPPLPPSIVESLRLMTSVEIPLWLTLAVFAGAPAICEELAFRGFILSGFLKNGRVGLAIVLSSLAFGLMHMIPQQVFNATLLGLVLGLLAVRSRSLWPGVVFHFLFNGSQVVLGRTAPQYVADGYPWPVLLLCVCVAVPLIAWLIRGEHRASFPSPRAEEKSQRDDLFVEAS